MLFPHQFTLHAITHGATLLAGNLEVPLTVHHERKRQHISRATRSVTAADGHPCRWPSPDPQADNLHPSPSAPPDRSLPHCSPDNYHSRGESTPAENTDAAQNSPQDAGNA